MVKEYRIFPDKQTGNITINISDEKDRCYTLITSDSRGARKAQQKVAFDARFNEYQIFPDMEVLIIIIRD